ncbi:MAG: T9SS type A sorting domain-containing protein [Bacteroidetes bacterium]|nr:T9SS type A sorting domain-containing protein [Bacteroidota bacterium]
MRNSTFPANCIIFIFVCCTGLFTSLVGKGQTQTVVYSTPGTFTWTAPCGVTKITVQAWGGGGAGGGSSTDNIKGGGGGAGGAYVSSTIYVVPNTTYTLKVGRGANGDQDKGNQGVGSWFIDNTTLYAEGGKGGKAPNGGTVAGGIGSYTSSIGTIRIAGSNGANGTSNIGGAGGMGANSGGVGGGARTSGGDGNPGSQPGGGGGGAFVNNSNNRNGGDGGDGEIIITYDGIATYCIPSFTYTEPITYVNFAGISNTTSATPYLPNDDYWSYCMTGNVTVGNTYPITLKGNTVGNYTDYFKVFIDWDHSGTLDPGEAYPLGTIHNSTGTDGVSLTANIAVPAGAVIGTTRMRIIKNYNGYGNACDSYTWGQAEDYLLNVSANCTAPTGAAANGTTGTLTVCTGTQVTLQQTGGALGTGQSWKWYAGGCGSGTAINSNTNADASYAFTPSVGTTTYYVRAEGGVCGTGACKSVTVVVKDNATISVTPGYSKDFSACLNVSNAAFTKFDLGGGATGATITGLPAGLTYNTTGTPVVISGTPTVAGSFNYTIIPTGNAPCTNTGINGIITVSQAPTSVTYTTPVVYCSGAAITPNVPVIGTGTGIPTNYFIVGSPSTLPAGLSLDPSTGIISGTPTAISAATNYTIQVSNACGSVNTIVNIAVSAGDQVFDITPSGNMDVCSSSFTGATIGLTGSQPGVSYQLYLNGTPVGTSVPGTGASISFGNQTTAGIYTVTTTSSCATNMNGSLTVNITPQPNVSFSYLSAQYCSQGLSDAPVLSGSPQTGIFSATPSGLVFSNTTTGVIDLAASAPGTYTIVYTVAASGGCSIYTSPGENVTIGATPQVFNVYGGGGYCSGGSGVEVGLDNSETGINYQLYRDGTTLVNTLPGNGSVLSFGNQTIAGTYTIVALNPPCQLVMNGTAVVVVNPNPSPIIVAPASSAICQGSVQALTVSVNPPVTSNGSVTLSSGDINLAIPDNSVTGVMNLIKLTGVPVGATITSVSIKFKITHTNDGDLLINLKGPNNNVLNIANENGGNGKNFNNTTVASNASTNISFGSAPFNSINYLPLGSIGAIGANVVTSNVSTVANFSGLYGSSAFSANGNWVLSVRDKANGHNGTLNNWSITINYTYVSNIVNVTWTPSTDLFTDQYATTAYTDGDELSTVYAKPSTYGSATYTATAKNEYGCTVTSDASLTINQSPQLSVAADYCSRSAFNQVEMTATSDIDVTIADWQWSGGLTITSADNRTSVVRTKNAGTYYVTAKSVANGCTATTSMSIAEELVTNGDFELGNTGFTSGYNYVSNTIVNGLWPEGTYTVNNNPNLNHSNFWGTDHTTADGSGNFMLINGLGGTNPPIIWSETVTVLPNTTYYFSAYAVSLNNVTPFANLKFRVNGVQVGTNTGTLPSKSSDNNAGTWIRFYGTWPSGTATTAVIDIVDLEGALGGNDFGLDDISFGTLSSFLNLTSGTGSNNQTNLCYNTPINTISYEVGGDGTQPVIDNLPTGLNTYWNGRDLIITGTPTQSGTFNYTVHGTGDCNTRTATGTIQVYAPAYAGDFASPVISACYGSGGTVDLSNTVGNILKWQSSTDGSTWSDVSNTTTSLSYTNITSPIYYRAVAQNGASCPINTSASVKLGIHNYWSGTSSSSWDMANNWSDVQLPSMPCVVVIPAGTPYSPQLNADVSVNDIIINNGAKLDMNNHILTIAGSYTGTGTLTGSLTSGLVLTGNTGTLHFTPNVYPSNTTNNYLKTLTVNSAAASVATIGDSLNIAAGNLTDGYGTVTVTGGSLNANGNLILKSDVNGTARIGYSSGKITGEAIVERFVPGLRSWRFMAVPFGSSSQTMRDAWQEGVNNYTLDYSLNLNPHPGFGTHITGDNISTKGYDLNTTTNPSVKVWDPNASNWSLTEPQTAYTNITDFNAYCLFIRGSRNVNLSMGVYAPTDDTRLRIKGTLNQTGLTAVKNYSGIPGGIVFVGNPYASTININNLINNTPEIQADKFWLWDPKMTVGTSYNVGGYVTYTSGIITPFPSPSYPTASSALEIQSGQAFMVQLGSDYSSATMKFKESDKTDEESNVFGFTGKNSSDQDGVHYPVIYTNLMAPDDDNNLFLADGVAAAFDNKFSKVVDEYDAQKKWGFNENMSLFRDSNYLAIELRPEVKLTDTLFYRLFLYKKPYVLKLFAQNAFAMPLVKAWLVDRYLNTKTEVNLNDTTLYSFTPNEDLNSYRDRFILVFNKQLGTIPVPVTRAANQKDPNTSGISESVDFSNGSISISPNPVTTAKNAMLRFSNIPKGEYEIVVYDSKGQKLATKNILHNVNTAVYNLPSGPSWASGIYIVNVVNENSKQSAKIKLVISR